MKARPRGLGHTALQLCLLLMSACLCSGCLDPGGGERPLPVDGEDLPILRQFAAAHSHETRAMQVVVRDLATLAKIPLHDVPVDLEEEMLLIVTLGRVHSDNYAVQIDRVWREGHHILVSVSVTTPDPGLPMTMASPYCIAVVPRCDLNVQDFDPEPPFRRRSWGQSEVGLGP